MNTTRCMKLVFLLICNFTIFSTTINASYSDWRGIPGGLKHVTASVNYLWGVNIHNSIFMCARPCTGAWRQIPGYKKQVDASDEEVWGVNNVDRIWKRSVDGTGDWKYIGGRLKHVSASGNGYVWGVNSNDDIYKCKKPCNGAWVHVAGKLKQIDGGQDFVYGVNSRNDIFSRPVDGSGSWRHIPGKMKHVTASGSHEVFGVDVNDNVWRCQKPCVGNWVRMSAKLSQIDATNKELVGVSYYNSIQAHDL